MSFLFRFQSLLKLRRHQLASEKQELHILLQQKQSIQNRINKVKSSLNNFEYPAENQQQTNLNVIKNHYKYLHNQQHALLALHNELNTASDSIEKQKQNLIEADRSAKVLEKLEYREKLKYYKAMQDNERKQLNEIGTLIYNRVKPTWI